MNLRTSLFIFDLKHFGVFSGSGARFLISKFLIRIGPVVDRWLPPPTFTSGGYMVLRNHCLRGDQGNRWDIYFNLTSLRYDWNLAADAIND